MKKHALGLSGEAATLMGDGGGGRVEGKGAERKSRVVRHKRNSFGDTGTSPSCSHCLVLFFLFFSTRSSLPVPSGPETPCFFTGLWDFFHADRRVVHQKGLTVSLFPSLFHQRARTFVHTGEEEMREKEGKSTGKEGRTIKKRKCQPP